MPLPTNPNPPQNRFGISLWLVVALLAAALLLARIAPALTGGTGPNPAAAVTPWHPSESTAGGERGPAPA